MKGHQIHNLRELKQAANERRSVVVPKVKVWKPWPAAVMINQQGWVLLDMFNKGMFIYEKEGGSQA